MKVDEMKADEATVGLALHAMAACKAFVIAGELERHRNACSPCRARRFVEAVLAQQRADLAKAREALRDLAEFTEQTFRASYVGTPKRELDAMVRAHVLLAPARAALAKEGA